MKPSESLLCSVKSFAHVCGFASVSVCLLSGLCVCVC